MQSRGMGTKSTSQNSGNVRHLRKTGEAQYKELVKCISSCHVMNVIAGWLIDLTRRFGRSCNTGFCHSHVGSMQDSETRTLAWKVQQLLTSSRRGLCVAGLVVQDC